MNSDERKLNNYADLDSFEAALTELSGTGTSEGLVDLFVDAVPAILGILDTEQRVLRYNRAGYKFFGLTPEETAGKKCFELIGRDRCCDSCATSEALATGQPSYVEKYFADLDQWFDIRAYPIRSSSTGEITGVIEHLRDITRGKESDNALASSEIRHMHLLQTMQEGLVEQTCDELTYVNESFCRMTGYDRSELVGSDARILFDELNWEHFCVQQELRGQGKADPYEIEMRRKDGSALPVFVSPYAEVYEGKLVKSTGVITDITILKETEQEKLQLTAQVQYAQKLESLGVLAGGIAHDFNNLLMTVLGNADLVLGELPQDSPVADSMGEIVNAARQASDLADQMMAYAGRGTLQKEPMDLNETVTGMIRLMEVSFARHGTVELNLDPDLPMVMADPAQLRQIIMNLVTNASEAIGDSGSSVRVSTFPKVIEQGEILCTLPRGNCPEGSYVCLEVRDDGCGIDDDIMDRLFDPFFTTKMAGRGLGLAVLLGIVGSHAGCVKVESDPGKGSCFSVFLPVHSEQAAARTEPEAEVTQVLTVSGSVLVIDDEAPIRDVTTRMIQRLGISSVQAEDLESAREYLKQPGGDTVLIIVDHSMPELSGDQLMRGLGELAEGIPVVVSSGFSCDEVLGQYDDIGISGFLQKPYGTRELSSVIREVLEG